MNLELNKMPPEIILAIAEQMDIGTFIQFSTSVKRIYQIINGPNDRLWQHFHKRDFPNAIQPSNGDFKQAYKEEYQKARELAAAIAKKDLKSAIEANETDKVEKILQQYPQGGSWVYEKGKTPLHLALTKPKLFEVILKTPHADVNERDPGGHPLLYDAVIYGSSETVKCLVDSPKIEINAQSKWGSTAFDMVLRFGKFEIIPMMLPKLRMDDFLKQGKGRTALHFEAMSGNTEKVNQLLFDPALDVNQKEEHQYTALHYASFCGQTEAVKSLLSSPFVDLEVKDYRGNTALHLACAHGNDETVKYLLSSERFDLHARNYNRYTPLHEAVLNKNIEVVKLLVSMPEVDVNCVGFGNQTPLIIAADQSDLSSATTLLERTDLDPYIGNDLGETAFDLAERSLLSEIRDLFNRYKSARSSAMKRKAF